MKTTKLCRAPYGLPNALQVTDDGLWVVDQISDRLALIEIAEPNEHGVTMLIREIPTESSNTSGMAAGGGSLWLAANGRGSRWRPARQTDAESGEVLRIDPSDGRTLDRWPMPGGGGVHGIEYDHFEAGLLWVTTLKDQTLSKVRINDWSVQQVIDLPYNRAHGVVRVEDGIWVVFTSNRVIVKFNMRDGTELDRIQLPEWEPQPHGLSHYGDGFLYCDALSGWIAGISL